MARPFKEIIMAEKKECEHCRGTGRYYNQDYSSNYTGPVCSYCNGHGYIMVEYDSSSSSSYTPSSSGGSSGFNYAGDVKDFEKIMHHAYDLIDTGNFDAAIDVAGRLADSFTWEEKLVKIANSVLKNAKSRKAEAEANPAKALVDQGFFAYQKKDNAKAVELWKKAADLGSEKALEFLSRMNVQYTSASGGSSSASANDEDAEDLFNQGYDAKDEEDYDKAVPLFQKAADMGNAEAMVELGDCYFDGNGVSENKAEGVKWYKKAAELGDEVAQNNMGYAYQHGEGVKQDLAKAKEWYEKAAKQGNANATSNLGTLYRDGLGVPKDLAKAKELFTKAVGLGSERAKEHLAKLK